MDDYERSYRDKYRKQIDDEVDKRLTTIEKKLYNIETSIKKILRKLDDIRI